MPIPVKQAAPVSAAESVATPAPARNITAEANKNIAAAKTGHDFFAPVRVTAKFIGGTVIESLNGMARYGRKGLAVGIGLGIVAAIATGGLSALFGVAIGGLAVGMAGGGLAGALTGGAHAVGRDHRAKKYAEDLIQRKQVQDTAAPNRNDYRKPYRSLQNDESFKTQQLLVRTNENTRDFNTYWQDREADRRNRLPQEHGLGF